MLVLKEIPGYSKYKAGSDGRIHSSCRKISIVLKSSQRTPKSYLHVVLSGDDGTLRTRDVHPLICEAFHGKRPEGFDCSHINGNKFDNRPENLRWETRKENFARKKEHGTHDGGCANSRAKLDKEQISFVKHMLKEGEKHHIIAGELGVNRVLISKIANGSRYANEF